MKSVVLSIVLTFSSLHILYGQWEDISINTSTSLSSIDFLDNDNGYVTGENLIYRTSDGGANWELSFESDLKFDFLDVYTLDKDNAFAVGSDRNSALLLRTEDNGLSWIRIPLGDPFSLTKLTSITFTSALIGYCTDSKGRILKTIDGGLTWDLKPDASFSTDNVSISIDFTSDSTGIVVGDRLSPYGGSSFIAKTEDGGDSWELLSAYMSEYPSDRNKKISIFFSDDETAYLLEKDGLSKTLDCGENWIARDPEFKIENKGIFFTDNNTGYVVGSRIQKTTSGGEDWEEITPVIQGAPSNSIEFNSIDFPNPEVGYVAGDNGKIFKIINTGTISMDDLTDEQLEAITIFPNPTTSRLTISSPELGIQRIDVLDGQGQTQSMQYDEVRELIYDLQGYVSGLYFFSIHTEKGRVVKKVVVE